jgi:large subunit ribosomal protein L25
MMTEFKLKTSAREQKPNQTRRDGNVPAIVYGKGFDSVSIALDKKEFAQILKTAGTSNLIEMSVNDKKVKTLIHNLQLDPLTGEVIHADFIKVNMKEKIHAEIPLKIIGDSVAVIDMEGSFINPVDSIEVECLPADLISEVEVDISVLDDFDKNIKVSDLKLPDTITLLSDPEEIIAFVQAPRSEEELDALNEEVVEDVSTIEVENKGEETPADGEGAIEKDKDE